MLSLEVDENQQKYYMKSDENNRYDELFMDFSVSVYSLDIILINVLIRIIRVKIHSCTIEWKH